MAKRGFFAELNYQAQQAEKRQRQQQAAAVRAAQRGGARRGEGRPGCRTRSAQRLVRPRPAEGGGEGGTRLHVEAREAEVEELNTELTSTYEEIDRLLEATLEVDDYVDLETSRSLKSSTRHSSPAPGRTHAADGATALPPGADPGRTGRPRGSRGAFGGKKKHAAAVERPRPSTQRRTVRSSNGAEADAEHSPR